MIPAEAVEAAANALRNKYAAEVTELPVSSFLGDAQTALEAAAPHMLADKRGEGDYMPGWDDRKTLASLWQEHAMLPVDGLSERVYDALIAVATWGYRRRKDEDL